MADFTLTIPDAEVPLVLAAFEGLYPPPSPTPTVAEDGTEVEGEPIDPYLWARNKVIDYIQSVVVEYQRQQVLTEAAISDTPINVT